MEGRPHGKSHSGGHSPTDILSLIHNTLSVPVEGDGLIFDSGSLQSEQITEDADCKGVRVRFRGSLDTAKIVMQIDIGFGDIVYPESEEAELPTMLDFPAPKLLCYSGESATAEKFDAIIKLGFLNSRMIKEAEAILAFWSSDLKELANDLNKQPNLSVPEFHEKPLLKLGCYGFQLPWLTAAQNTY